MARISIIVPVYKVEKYIHRCVDSILNQTFTDFELILVDDGSPDNCGIICDEYAAKDSRVVVIHQENGGLSAARNAGLRWVFDNSQSGWITFVDSDDWVHPQYLECLWKNTKRYDVKLSICHFAKVSLRESRAVLYDALIGEKKKVTECELERLCYGSGSGGFAWGKLIDREILSDLLFAEGKIYEDSAITCKWFFEAQEYAEIALPLYYYYINDQGIMRSKFSRKQLDILWSKDEQERFYESVGYSYMRQIVAKSYIMSAARCYRALISELGDREKAIDVKRQMIKKLRGYRGKLDFSKEEKNYIIQMLHPKLMDGYWFLKAVVGKVFGKRT